MPRKRRPDLTRKPRLTIAQILVWADEYRRRHGTWPYIKAGPIEGVPGETWCGVNFALYGGKRGLRGKSSLAYLLLKRRNVVTRRDPLDEETIFRWALAHCQRTGRWPTGTSAAIQEAPAETWGAINEALIDGRRSLPGGSSLSKLLKKNGISRKDSRKIIPAQILIWADEFFAANGHWPYMDSGPIRDSRGETWASINDALCRGTRGFDRQSSLPRFLNEHRNVFQGLKKRPHRVRPERRLDMDKILAWAKTHRRHTGAEGKVPSTNRRTVGWFG